MVFGSRTKARTPATGNHTFLSPQTNNLSTKSFNSQVVRYESSGMFTTQASTDWLVKCSSNRQNKTVKYRVKPTWMQAPSWNCLLCDATATKEAQTALKIWQLFVYSPGTKETNPGESVSPTHKISTRGKGWSWRREKKNGKSHWYLFRLGADIYWLEHSQVQGTVARSTSFLLFGPTTERMLRPEWVVVGQGIPELFSSPNSPSGHNIFHGTVAHNVSHATRTQRPDIFPCRVQPFDCAWAIMEGQGRANLCKQGDRESQKASFTIL